MTATQDIVAEVWKLCDILRDDGITYHQYVNELTYLLFLEMSAETGTERPILKGCRWEDLVKRASDPEEQYKLLGKAEFTVNEWCRLGRIYCEQIEDVIKSGLFHAKNWNALAMRGC